MKIRRMFWLLSLTLVLGLLLSACGETETPATVEESTAVEEVEEMEEEAHSEEEMAEEEMAEEEIVEESVMVDPSAALAALEGQVFSTGPGGESPTAASELVLTDEELATIQGMNATAAIVMHIGGNDWTTAQIDGLTQQFGKMGIEIIATTDANFRSEQQVSDIETVMAREPDIIVSIPTDPVATSAAYKAAADAGVQIVFMDNVPVDMVQGEDYVSVVSADNYGNGVVSAHLMAKELGSVGQVGIVFHAADFFVTRQRYDAFKATIESDYPGIEIVEEQGISGPDFAGDADKAASAMLTKHADLDGIWAVWDSPAEGVMSAIRANGREGDVIVTTIDLGKTAALEIANDGIIKGLGAQRPFDQGVAEAILAGYGLLGKEAPAYVALNALPVSLDNVANAWQTVYNQLPPAELGEADEPLVVEEEASSSDEGMDEDPLAAIANQVFSTGPGGEEPTAASELELTADELAQIEEMGATAAIVMHIGGNDWTTAQIDGLTEQFGKMGIEIIATTDANFRSEQQVSDLETVMALEPDIIVSIPTDPVATSAAYQAAADAGIQIVFMDNVPVDMVQGEDYVSVVSADNYGNGVVSAHLMAKALGGEGQVGIVFHAADFFVTRQRYDAFKATIEAEYPNIEIVEEQGISGPDFAGDADAAASAMLIKHADLDGIWAVWDSPAEGVMSAIRSNGREGDVIITTIDLGKTAAIEIANDGIIKGLGAQRPFDQGVAEAILAGYGLLGKEAPAYVALNALPVSVDNVAEAWETVYHQPAPDELK